MERTTNIVYISHDSIRSSLGKSQILAYLKLVVNENYLVFIVSFEKTTESLILGDKIVHLPVKRRELFYPIRFIFEVIDFFCVFNRISRRRPVDLLHARSFFPAFLSLLVWKIYNIKYVYDIRGFWIEEKFASRTWKKFEVILRFILGKIDSCIYRNSSATIFLTEKSRDYICSRIDLRKAIVIPTCVDFSMFYKLKRDLSLKSEIGLNEAGNILIFSGSIGGYYDVGRIAKFISIYLDYKSDNHCIVLTNSNTDELLRLIPSTLHFRIVKRSAAFEDIPKYLSLSDCGLVLYDNDLSSLARSPTKLGEYLVSGLYVFAPKGLGDLDLILEKAGQTDGLYEVDDFGSYRKSIEVYFNKQRKKHIRPEILNYYDLKIGTDTLLKIYANL